MNYLSLTAVSLALAPVGKGGQNLLHSCQYLLEKVRRWWYCDLLRLGVIFGSIMPEDKWRKPTNSILRRQRGSSIGTHSKWLDWDQLPKLSKKIRFCSFVLTSQYIDYPSLLDVTLHSKSTRNHDQSCVM